MKLAILFVGFFSLFISSCLMEKNSSVDLGQKYRYISDYPARIIYHESETYQGIGSPVIPPSVITYTNTERYIFAKSKDIMDGKNKYWIVDKQNTKEDAAKTVDSTYYVQLLNQEK